MVREDRVIMSVKALRRVSVIRQTMEKKLTQVKAGALLGLMARHIRRFTAQPAQAADLHRPRPAHRELDRILCLKTPLPAEGLHHRAPGQALSDPRDDPGPPCAGGRACEWNPADYPPGSADRRSHDHVAAREGRDDETAPPRSTARHAEAGPSVAQGPVARAHKPRGDGYYINRTFLLGLDSPHPRH
jgi:hypothetical protein